MDKVKFDIPRKEDGKWGSYISKYPADSGKVQANMLTSGTRNVITSATGQAEKRTGGAIWNPNSTLSGPALDQYEAVFNTGARLFVVNDAGTLKASTGNQIFTSIQAGLTNPANFEFVTYQGRVYGCNGVDSPLVIDIATSYGGVSYAVTVAKTRTMGAQPPVTACTASGPSAGGSVPVGSHTYKVTYVYYNGIEESNGNTASGVVAATAGNQTVSLTNIPVGGYGVTARNIYRDNNDGVYLLLTTISNNTATTYSDTLSLGSTPTPIPTDNGLPPIFKYAALFLDRLFVIDITGKNISWSTAGEPDVFRSANVISGPQDDVMTGIYVFNGIPWVFGQHTVGQILGTTDGEFYYSPVSSTVGCVDNRSIQTRSIISVPTLLWLAATPNKGIYYSNGSVVQYLSDYIEDLTFNLAQISYLERQNTQASQVAFQGGTASAGIDLTGNPGTIQTINPEASYHNAAAWALGTPTNLLAVGDALALATGFFPTVAAGSAVNTDVSSGNIQLAQSSAAQTILSSVAGTTFSVDDAAEPITVPFTGTLTNVVIFLSSTNGGTLGRIYPDNGGIPGITPISGFFSSSAATGSVTCAVNLAVTAGQQIWIDISSGASGQILSKGNGAGFGAARHVAGGGLVGYHPAFSVSFTGTQNAASGTWTSAVYDAGAAAVPSSVTIAGSYPATTTGSLQLLGSTDQSNWDQTQTFTSPNGTSAVSLSARRFWKFVVSEACSGSPPQATPVMGAPSLKFPTSGTWVSPAILCTADITALVSLVQTVTLPAGTSSTIEIRTGPNGSSWSSYSAVNLATPNTYGQVRVSLTTDTGNTVSPSLLSVVLDWAISSNLISSAIDTGTTPAGWGIFQFSQVGMSGTVQFYFRSAATALALAGATFSAVGNGGFPTSSPLEFCQWKVVMTAHANDIPQVNSVTINWLLSSGNIVRAASLFFNKSYYLAVATQGSTYNDTLIELDYEGNWRIHSGANIGAMATYFNDAFYCDSVTGNVYNAFRLPTDNGTPITFDLRTKAFGKDDSLTIIRSLRVVGVQTGTTIHAYYSVDKGTTWNEMLNSSGTLGYTTNVSGDEFNEYFVPNFAGAAPVCGTNVIFRLVSSDAFACQILRLSPDLRVRKGKFITEANA